MNFKTHLVYIDHREAFEIAPGTKVHRDIRHLLYYKPFNQFYEGETVGYQRSLKDVCFPVDECPAPETWGTLPVESEHSSDESTEIVFAEIVEQIDRNDASTPFSSKFKIDIGPKGPIIVKVTALYKFLLP